MAAHSLVLAFIPCNRMPVMSRASLNRDYKMRVPYELKQGQSRLFHELPSGLSMEVIFHKGLKLKDPDEKNQYPPLVFIHGSFHAAWCWAEHWLPFFSNNGYDCYALSLLGQGESDAPAGTVAGSLKTHAGNVADFIRKETKLPPVLVGHSFGGLIVQYYIANVQCEELSESWIRPTVHGAAVHNLVWSLAHGAVNSYAPGAKRHRLVCTDCTAFAHDMENLHPDLHGAVLVCSVPPSGNSGLVWRYLFSKPIAAYKVTRSLAAKGFQTSLALCRETFFSAEMEDHLVLSYQKLMRESSRMPLFDLRKLNASLPVPSVRDSVLKILVLGANDDFIVDAEGLEETGRFYGVTPVCIKGVAHDMMLDNSWEKGAENILSWLNGLKREKAI